MERGRPTKYRRDYHPHLARQLAREGKTDEQIAAGLGIGTATHYRWLKQHTEYRRAVSDSKAVADFRVEQGLFARALGYTEERVEERYNKEGEFIGRKVIRRPVPPSVYAQRYWLKNRRAEQWREVVQDKGGGPEAFLRFLDAGDDHAEV